MQRVYTILTFFSKLVKETGSKTEKLESELVNEKSESDSPCTQNISVRI